MKISDQALSRLRDAADWPHMTGDRYVIRERIGQGGMGSVYLAMDTELHRQVAVKVMRAPAPAPEAEGRMRREAQVIARLEHPGIVPVHDIGRLEDGRIFYVMKWVRGVNLEEFFPGRSPSELLRTFLKVGEAVAFAHDHGVIHRDIKPGNIMVGVFGEVLLLDWGVAKVLTEGHATGESADGAVCEPGGVVTQDGVVVGTPGYMAPEQASGKVHLVDQRTDVYALGAILQFLFPGASAPRPLAAIRDRALQPAPDERYPTVGALSADILNYLDGQAVSAYRENLLERWRRVFRRFRTPILLILSYLVMRAILALLVRRQA
jgi:eukaryotic-like serine/threonine-protein kinase